MKDGNYTITQKSKKQIFYVGIDVHKNFWVVTIRTENTELRTISVNPNPKGLATYLRKNYSGGIYKSAYEAGFCGFWIHRQLMKEGIDNIVIHAADVPTTHKEKVNKTDKVDSRKIAKELENGNLKGIYVPEKWNEEFRSFCRLYCCLTSHSSRLKNRIKCHLHYYGISLPKDCECRHWSLNFIKYLESLCSGEDSPRKTYLRFCIEELKEQRHKIVEIRKELKDLILANPSASSVIELLNSVVGIGFTSALFLYAEIMDINRFRTLDKLASFVGIVPSCHSSGERDSSSGLTPRKNPYLRYVLIEAAWIAVRKDPELSKYYSSLLCRMKKTDAIIRVAKKLLNRIRFVWKNGEKYKRTVN